MICSNVIAGAYFLYIDDKILANMYLQIFSYLTISVIFIYKPSKVKMAVPKKRGNCLKEAEMFLLDRGGKGSL